MTQALLPLSNSAIPGVERCEVEVPKTGVCPGSAGLLDPQPNQRVDRQMVGESDIQLPKSKAEKIQEGLERTISDEAKQRIENVLNEVNQLSDVEKLLLYLKLPTGSALFSTKDGTAPPTATPNRLETIQAATWIKSHLEEDVGTSLPKQEVFEDYRVYCESHGYKPLSQADFGKAMKCVFPNVKARRLGQRGQSKHCYGGLRKKLCVKPPILPDLCHDESPVEPKKEEESSGCDELVLAASDLVCEWSQKLLNHQFGNLKDLAVYLIDNMYVSSRSMAAFTVITSTGKGDAATKPSIVSGVSTTPSTSTLSRHRETQLQLQRKLQEREQIKEQKRKLEQQRSAMKSRGGDASDSRSADDSSRESERSDSGGSLSRSGSSSMTSVTMPKVMQQNESSWSKLQTPLTPQKVLLPKIGPTPASAAHKLVVVNESMPATSANTVNGSAAGPQQILVFSPTPHMSQPATQQLVILSPIGRGTTSMQPANIQQAIQPVLMSTINSQTRPQMTTQFAPKTVNVMQVPLLQTQVSNQSLSNVIPVTTTVESHTEQVIKAGQPNIKPELASNNSEVTRQLASGSQFVVVTQTTSSTVLSQARDIAHWSQSNSGQIVTASNGIVTQVTAHQQMQQQPQQQRQVKQEQQQHMQKHQLAGHLLSTPVINSSTAISKQTSTVLIDSPTPIKIVTTAASSPKSDNLHVCASNAAPKVTSKTVSDLLKEQRGYNNGSDSKMPYVNDRRPVSELLKDIRAKRLSTPVLAQALAPQTTLSPKMLSTSNSVASSATVSIDHSPRMTAPLPIISDTVMANTQELPQISDNNNRSKPASLQELLAKADHDLQPPTVSLSTTERLRQVLVQSGVAKKRSLTTSDILPCKRPNLGVLSQDTIQKKAASIIRNPELANALMAVTPIPSKMELLKQELERQLATTRSNDQPAGFASRLAISLAKGGYISQSEIIKELQNQHKLTVVKSEFSRGENLSNLEKDALVDFFDSDPDPELADITPSIAQMVQLPGVQNNQQLVQQSSIDKDDGSSNESKSDVAYNLSEVLMKASSRNNPQIKKENSNSNHLMYQLITGQSDQPQPPQQQLQQQAHPQQPAQPMSAPGSRHSTPCPSPGPSDPRQPFINLRGDVLLSQTATPKSAQITQWQRQFLQNHQQQQQQKQQHRQYHHQRQRHRSMPDQVLRQQISNINLTQPPIQQTQRQAQAELFASSALLPGSSPSASATSPAAPPQGAVMVTTMAEGRAVQLQPQLLRSTSAQDMVMVTVSQQQALTAAIQSNPALTAQLIQNNLVLNLTTQVQQQQQQQNMQELQQQQQQQISNSGMTLNVAISGSNNTGMISLPQSPSQLMSPNSGSAQRSAASTPMSVLSPQTPMSHGMGQSRSIGPSPVEMTSHAFMPIQNLQLESGGNVSLVRPTATIASTAAQSTVVNAMEQQLAVAESSSFQRYSPQPSQVGPVRNAVSFMTREDKKSNPPNYNLLVGQKLAQTLGLHSAPNIGIGKETAHFAPASSIKPVKRGGRGTNKGASGRRQRHHSAQSALGGHHQTQSNTANLLHRRSFHQNQTESQPQQPPQAATGTAVIGDVNMGLGPSTPESPFSPEIQDILNSASQGGGGNNTFRSQSVPVTDLFFDVDYSSSSDMFPTAPSSMEQQKDSELMDDFGGDMSSLTSLLQGKLQEDGSSTSRGLHALSGEAFVARRNLTELIEQRSTALTQNANSVQMKNLQRGNPSFAAVSNTFDFDDNNSSQSMIGFRGRGDVTLTSASLCDNTQLRRMQGLSVVLPSTTSNSGLAAAVSQPSNAIDFSAEVQNLVGQSSSSVLQVNRMSSSVGSAVSTLDTPSSMDTMSTQDSRDSLADSLFQTTYDTSNDFSQNLSNTQSMDMVSSSDFTFPQWEMSGQLVHD